MKVKVSFFARYRELVGKEGLELEVAEGTTTTDLKEMIEQKFPQLKGLCQTLLLAVDGEYVPHCLTLNGGEEIAFLPPLSGG